MEIVVKSLHCEFLTGVGEFEEEAEILESIFKDYARRRSFSQYIA